MSDRGHNVTVLTTRNRSYERNDQIFFPNTRIFRTPLLLSIKAARVFLHPLMFNRFKKYDIVHAFTFFTFSSVAASFFRANKYFLRSEILDSKQTNCLKAEEFIYKALLLFYKNFYSKIYGYSVEEVSILKTFGFPERNVFLLPPMVDSTVFSHFSRKLQVSGAPLIIGTIGRISPTKGMHNIFRILEHLIKLSGNDFRFVLAGRIDNQKYAQSVFSKLSMVLGNKFTYLGEIPSPKVFYEQVDVVIVPSLEMETGSIVTLEAMAAGKVVIANNLYPMNLYIRNSINGFLYDSFEDAGKKIARLFDEPELKESLSNAAQKDSLIFDLAKVCEDLEQEYFKAY